MKYPQLVSMPSAVQDWLDEQLEARGIDAVVYTRYILSLLQRDTLDLPDDLLALSPNKGKEVGRRGRKRGRNREEYWDVWDCEQLKRSAAVECLMSASDQKCGIEKLVDELCAKLKEIQSEGESSIHLELSQASVSSNQTHTPSPQDQVQKYYAAFPPLNSKFAESSNSLITLIPEPSSAWSGKKVLANSFGKNKTCSTSLQEESSTVGKLLVSTTCWEEENKENRGKNNSLWKEIGRENMKSSNQTKEKARGKKEVCYGFAWNMADEQNESYTNFCSVGGSENNSSELLRVFHCNRQNRGSKTDVTAEKELQAHRSNGWESAVCRRLYERQTDDDSVFSGSTDQVEVAELQNKCNTGNDNDVAHGNSPGQGADDRNLAQLIAKFDHSIEALWNPDDAPSSPDNFSSDGTVDCDQDLPLDFQQLLSSPSEQYLTVELYNLSNKRNTNAISSNNSFIQCGTNITSSIWSDQPSQENSIEQDDFGMDYVHCDQQNMSDDFEDGKAKLSNTCFNEKEVVGNKYTVLVVGEGKIVGNKCNTEEQLKGSKSERKDHSSSLFKDPGTLEIEKCCESTHTEGKSKLAWNKYDNFPSFFASLPWAVNYSLGENTQGVGTKKWSDVETLSTQGSYSSFGNIFSNGFGHVSNPVNAGGNHFNSCMNVGLSDSLNTLNHNREDSSFTEVIPKQNSYSGLLTDKMDAETVQQKKINVPAEHEYQVESKDCEDTKTGTEIEREEEDLLTSARTHFRPIRMESMDSQRSTNAGNNNNVGCYADGTTFVIPTSLEEVAFRRSESGALYLEAEADTGVEIPNKYMEYKEKEAYGGRHRYEERPQSADENLREFVPKFKVRQNEKCCQTEDSDDMLHSDEEIDTKRSRQEDKVVNDPDDFYFPDDHFAEKIINSLEDNCESVPVVENRNDTTRHMQTEKYVPRNSSFLKYSSCSRHENRFACGLGSETLNEIAPKRSSNSKCKCNNTSHHLQTWKTGWPKSSQISEPNVWEPAGSDKPQSWYNIWRSSPGPSTHPCQCGVSPPVGISEPCSLPDKGLGKGETDTRSLQYSRLREELTMEGEQLLSDLSYMQHLYQGSDWQDENTPGEESVPDWRPEQEEFECDRKLRCLSPAEDSTQEMMMYAEDAGCTRSLPAPLVDHQLPMKETKSVDDFDTSWPSSTFPRTALLSTELEAEWKQNERPFNAKAIQKDRKRRHSASQRACSYYLEGTCRRPHCRFSHDLATVPCRFWADSSCLKGIACPFLHGSAQALRPVTL